MDKRIKVLFITNSNSTFIKMDLELLKNDFNVISIDLSKHKMMNLVSLIRGVIWADITFSWFASYHAFAAVLISKIIRRKSIVVLGGYEVAKIPAINYGLLLNPIFAFMVKFIFNNASKILAVDEGLRADAINNLGIDGKNILVVPTGYDHDKYIKGISKENIVLSVSTGKDYFRVLLKGLDTFVKAARLMPDVKFIIIGLQGEALLKLKTLSPSNVIFIDHLSSNDLITYYQEAKCYCQLSMREGLPNALCEAMLCECVPVGTNIPGIKSAIGDTGYYVQYGSENETVIAINKALSSEDGYKARLRIIQLFPLSRRKTDLVNLIENLFANSSNNN